VRFENLNRLSRWLFEDTVSRAHDDALGLLDEVVAIFFEVMYRVFPRVGFSEVAEMAEHSPIDAVR